MASGMPNVVLVCKEEIECAICLSRFKTPRALTCLHSFCENCLTKKHEAGNKNAKEMTCPLCQKRSKIPEGGVSGFPLDFRALRLIEAVEKDEPSTGPAIPIHVCDVCGQDSKNKDTAFIHCRECVQIMCKHCAATHGKMGSSKGHTVTNADEFVLLREREKLGYKCTCEKHNGIKFDTFCISCMEPMCQVCAASDHPQSEIHKLTSIEEHYPKMREEIDKHLSEVKQKSEECSALRQLIDCVRKGIAIQSSTYKKDVEEAVVSYSTRLNYQGRQLVKAMNNNLKTEVEHLEQLSVKVDRIQESLRSIIKGQLLKDSSDPIGLATYYRELFGSLNMTLIAARGENFVESFKLIQGSIDDNLLHHNKTQIWTSLKELGEKINLERQTIPVSKLSGPIAFMRDGRLIAFGKDGDTYSILQTTCSFPACYEFVLTLTFQLKEDIRFLMPLSSNVIAANSMDNIYLFDVQSGSKRVLHKKQLNASRIYCLSTDLKGHIYVADRYTNDQYRTKVDIFKPSGETVGSKVLYINTPSSNVVDSVAFCPSVPSKIAVTAYHQNQRSAYVCDLQSGKKLHDILTGITVQYSAIACDQHLLYILWSGGGGIWSLQRFTMDGKHVDTIIDKELLRVPCNSDSKSRLPFAVSLEGVVALVTYSSDGHQVNLIATNKQ